MNNQDTVASTMTTLDFCIDQQLTNRDEVVAIGQCLTDILTKLRGVKLLPGGEGNDPNETHAGDLVRHKQSLIEEYEQLREIEQQVSELKTLL